MGEIRDYRRMLEEGFAQVSTYSEGPARSRLEYLAGHVFDFTTYDSEMSELFATKALEVCAAISDRTTFEYIEDQDRYRWFLLMCNMPFFAGRLEWGTSIRGAWWDTPPHELIGFSSCGLWLDGKQLTDTLQFTREQWEEFIAAVLAFARSGELE